MVLQVVNIIYKYKNSIWNNRVGFGSKLKI